MSHSKDFEYLKIELEAIKSATNNFSAENIIGKGGFGKVYKGEIVHFKGKSMVAFKRLDRSFGQGNPEFWKEIMTLSLYQHENIVSFLGFCDESDEKILMYEYASKRSLNLYLDNNDLTWIQRLEICIGAAKGLAYLHGPSNTHTRVLHRDIKSFNILLDEKWNAKISDFGLSKFGPANQQLTFCFSNAVGTLGYCDPLYVEMGFLTKESDVYSFGVVLFEVLCGRLCISNDIDLHRPLTSLAREFFEQSKLKEIVFGSIKDEIHPNSLILFTEIAYKCLKKNREERPLMNDVVRILESALEYQVKGESLKLSNVLDSSDHLEVCRLEEESPSFFNIEYFENKVLAGEWDETERYLNRFIKVDADRFSTKIYFDIRKHKYYEALDRNDRANAVEILVKELKVFSRNNPDLYKEMTQLITLDNFRENKELSKYGDMITARHTLLSELIMVIKATPLIMCPGSYEEETDDEEEIDDDTTGKYDEEEIDDAEGIYDEEEISDEEQILSEEEIKELEMQEKLRSLALQQGNNKGVEITGT